MTTPTREQVVQWIQAAAKFRTGVYTETIDLVSFATLARADLEAKVAEQEAEIEWWRNTTIKAAVESQITTEQHNVKVLEKVALIAHAGGLARMTQDAAMNAIRKMTLPYFDLSKTTDETIEALATVKEK